MLVLVVSHDYRYYTHHNEILFTGVPRKPSRVNQRVDILSLFLSFPTGQGRDGGDRILQVVEHPAL
jgi:hypothetical protein